MTMPRGASRALYAGNGQATEFPFFFKVFEEDQLSVRVTSPDGVTSLATGWSVALDESGGTITYLHNGAPLREGWKLAIMRDMPFVQEVDLITGTRFDPEVIETALDVATAERQQLLERLDRAVVVEPTDEGGPEALLADIRDARSSAQSSASSALASATAAADSAQSAGGSAAIATEQREAACICAQESQAARDAAIAQAEAANTLMEAELAKVNTIVAANKTDQQAAVTAARQWAEKAPDMPVDYDEDGNPRYSALHWADKAQKLAINPDGETVTVDADGVLSALGGNLLLNAEEWIIASGEWEAPVTGWYEVLLIGGGGSGRAYAGSWYCAGGGSGKILSALVHLTAGQEVPVVVGAGGAAPASADGSSGAGGETSFGDLSTATGNAFPAVQTLQGYNKDTLNWYYVSGQGLGGSYPYRPAASMTQAEKNARCAATGHLGGGGAAALCHDGMYAVGAGAQGSVRVRWHDPAKAAGPLPALFAARRRAARAAAEPVLVNLYDPETGQGSVWRPEDVEAKLAEGLITEEAWLAICAEQAAVAHAAWLADPATGAERFEMLRAARDGRLAATDYLLAPDYPLTDDQRAAVTVYRQALRDLPAEDGAPWDGGGELTPWPVMPLQAAEETPCA